MPRRRATAPQETGPIHWKCPTCMLPCRCTGDAQKLPHVACGTVIRGTSKLSDEGIRQAYESWLRARAVPGGAE